MKRDFLRGVRQALPIVLGYIPVGFAYGVLAQKSGLGLMNAVAMSVIVFAGSAQLIGAGLFGAGAGPLALIATTFVVNLRHLLMSAALAPKLRGWKKWQIAFFGYELTDETFALHTMRMAKEHPPMAETFGVNVTAQFSWIVGSLAGYLAGGQIADVRPVGLDYALPAMFIALLVPQIVKPVYLMMAVLACVISVSLSLLGFSQSHVIAATVIASTVGLGVEQWMNRSSS
ncbi:AzlC family ABC transporter permease [Desulfopila aestuarii]|uniref:4-azaleucine resistance probable transporter AzlC n=1 Tax=Desulfopila aestuarii DSM 18488 TaxID=1121416 RepID=A0A1M7Y730_9BACT|nr:AzlC family ABC transporter permease [Desulfopila aestuarii]SHO48326.1 4-azaleucine resistance probable transporter AzlC [Desulfopila aestuarii DSM 18488]